MSLIDSMFETMARLSALPPSPSRIIARDDVPRGRTFRQWDTKGRLIVYVNKGALLSVPIVSEQANGAAPLFGIPVVYE